MTALKGLPQGQRTDDHLDLSEGQDQALREVAAHGYTFAEKAMLIERVAASSSEYCSPTSVTKPPM